MLLLYPTYKKEPALGRSLKKKVFHGCCLKGKRGNLFHFPHSGLETFLAIIQGPGNQWKVTSIYIPEG
jgi:hypothetical protein